MKDYHELAPLVPMELVLRAKQLGSAALCDGMKGLGIERDGCMDAEMLPLEDRMSMAGTAYTVETKDGDNLPIHVAIYQGKPGYVLVIDGKNYRESPYMGDLMGGSAKAVGLEGVVLDGLARDKLGLIELQLPFFCKGLMQRGPGKKDLGKINTPIHCAGITVHPGDLVVGDADGVTVIPRDRIEEVLLAAENKLDYEQQRRDSIELYLRSREAGLPLPTLTPAWVTEMMNGK